MTKKELKKIVTRLLEKESEKNCILQFRFKMPTEIKKMVGTEQFEKFAIAMIEYFEEQDFEIMNGDFDKEDNNYYIVETAPRSLSSLILQTNV